MDRIVYLNLLYDCYKDMFTDKQQLYFESYYWENLSLGEIAENNNVSRNAINKKKKIMDEKLIDLENKLQLNKKKEKIIKLLDSEIDEELLEEIKKIL